MLVTAAVMVEVLDIIIRNSVSPPAVDLVAEAEAPADIQEMVVMVDHHTLVTAKTLAKVAKEAEEEEEEAIVQQVIVKFQLEVVA